MKLEKIKHVIYTPELESSAFVQSARECAANCIPVIDARSAVYAATGICAQNKEMVAVCLDAGNASRSAFSGMTEAYYRNLPVILITIGSGVDYSRELKDVVYGHYVVNSEDQIEVLLETKLPIHIELKVSDKKVEAYDCKDIYAAFGKALDKDDYLYIGQGIEEPKQPLGCKVVKGGMPDCFDGAMANVLGASLAKKHKRYIGLISEDEYIHDINTLGNIHVNDSLMFVVVAKKTNKVNESYAKSLGFEVCIVQKKEIAAAVDSMAHNDKKTVVFVV